MSLNTLRIVKQLRVAGLSLSLGLVACGGGGSIPEVLAKTENPLPLRPAGTPDYYVVGISGKCLAVEGGYPGSCAQLSPSSLQAQDTSKNYNYLLPRGTLEGIANTIYGKGWSAAYKGYAASLPDRINTSSGKSELHHGFQTLEAEVMSIYKTAIQGVRNPSKIVLVAHSHGVVWSHLFTMLHPEVPVEIQVDFDGVCLYWVTDNQGDLNAAGWGGRFSTSNICNGPRASLGGSSTDMQNITRNNVKSNVEIQSGAYLPLNLHDSVGNRRLDGSTNGIFTEYFGTETHSKVTVPGSSGYAAALRWTGELTPRK